VFFFLDEENEQLKLEELEASHKLGGGGRFYAVVILMHIIERCCSTHLQLNTKLVFRVFANIFAK
jgi:hypothetical protein